MCSMFPWWLESATTFCFIDTHPEVPISTLTTGAEPDLCILCFVAVLWKAKDHKVSGPDLAYCTSKRGELGWRGTPSFRWECTDEVLMVSTIIGNTQSTVGLDGISCKYFCSFQLRIVFCPGWHSWLKVFSNSASMAFHRNQAQWVVAE